MVRPAPVGIAAEKLLPHGVADDGDRVAPGQIVIGGEGAAERRLAAQQGEEIGRNLGHLHMRRLKFASPRFICVGK